MVNELSAERYSNLIGAIYDCVISPDLWQPTLAMLMSEFDFANAMLSVYTIPACIPTLHVAAGIPPDLFERLLGYGPSTIDLWGGPVRVLEHPICEPVVQSHVTPRSSWTSNRFAVEWAFPQGLHDCVGVALIRDSTMIGTLGLGRHEQVGEVTEKELASLRLVMPHLQRAVVIGRLFEQKGTAAATFSDVIDVLAAGVVIVDEHLAPIHVNATARAMLDRRDPIRLENGQISLPSDLATGILRDAARVAAINEAGLERRSIDVPIKRRDGAPSLVQILPLGQGDVRSSLVRRAAAAVFVADASAPPRLPADALALLYDLTPAETRVFELIVEGRTIADAAETLSIARATVKTHLQRVFDKTGCNRQADLVTLAATVRLPV